MCLQRRQAISEAVLEEEYRFCCPETNPVLSDLLDVAHRLIDSRPQLKAEIAQAMADNMSSEEFLGADNMRVLEYLRQQSSSTGTAP